MGVVSKYGNLYDVKKNIICHAPVTSSHFYFRYLDRVH